MGKVSKPESAIREGDDEGVLTFDAAATASWSLVDLVIQLPAGMANLSCSFRGGGWLGGVMA